MLLVVRFVAPLVVLFFVLFIARLVVPLAVLGRVVVAGPGTSILRLPVCYTLATSFQTHDTVPGTLTITVLLLVSMTNDEQR